MGDIRERVYWELDANKKMYFHTHLDVLAECFGVFLKLHQRVTWRLPQNEEWMVWFPHETKENKQKKIRIGLTLYPRTVQRFMNEQR